MKNFISQESVEKAVQCKNNYKCLDGAPICKAVAFTDKFVECIGVYCSSLNDPCVYQIIDKDIRKCSCPVRIELCRKFHI
jgi:hypothetical protein